VLGSDLTLAVSCTLTFTLTVTPAWDMHWKQLRAVRERQWAVLCSWPLLLAVRLVGESGCTAHHCINVYFQMMYVDVCWS